MFGYFAISIWLAITDNWYFKTPGIKWLQAEVKPFEVKFATLRKPHQPCVEVDILHSQCPKFSYVASSQGTHWTQPRDRCTCRLVTSRWVQPLVQTLLSHLSLTNSELVNLALECDLWRGGSFYFKGLEWRASESSFKKWKNQPGNSGGAEKDCCSQCQPEQTIAQVLISLCLWYLSVE